MLMVGSPLSNPRPHNTQRHEIVQKNAWTTPPGVSHPLSRANVRGGCWVRICDLTSRTLVSGGALNRNSVLFASRHRRVHRPTSPAVGDVASAKGPALVASGGGTAAEPDSLGSVAPSATGIWEYTGATSRAGPPPEAAPPPPAAPSPPAVSIGRAPSSRPLMPGGGTGSSTLADAESIPTSAAQQPPASRPAATSPSGCFRFETDQRRGGGGGWKRVNRRTRRSSQ